MSGSRWYLRTQDETFGPESEARLVEWAKLGRILPGQEISEDNIQWQRVEDVPFLDMRFSIDIGDGNPRGPFNRAAAEALLASGRLPPTASMVETREPFPTEEPVVAEEPLAEKPSGDDAKVQVVEKLVEKVVEKEVIKEVPVEKIVEKVVVDETRVRELEELLAEERRHTVELQGRIDASSRKAAEAVRAALERENALRAEMTAAKGQVTRFERSLQDAADRENKYADQVKALEDELRRLPQAASEVADIQAAVYSIITGESNDLARVLEAEKHDFEEFKLRHTERMDRLTERRRELLKRSGANIEDMTRKALLNRPEDPRTTQLRKELEELRRIHDNAVLDHEAKVRELSEQLRLSKSDNMRAAAELKDVTQLRQEVEALKEQLQLRETELVAERQKIEDLRRQQATKQQVLLARLASLESPSIGSAGSLATNQSRATKQVKLPGWMSFRK